MITTFSKQLSAKLVDGKKQVLVRVTFSKTNRVSLKTGIFVIPSYFNNGEINKSKPGRKNPEEAKQTELAYFEMEKYCKKISRIAEIATGHLPMIEKNWLEKVLELDKLGQLDLLDPILTFDTISNLLLPPSSGVSVLVNQSHVSSSINEPISGSIYTFFDHFCKSHEIAHTREVNYKTLRYIIFRYERFERLVSKREGYRFSPSTISINDIIGVRDYMRREQELSSLYPREFAEIVRMQSVEFPYLRKQAKGYGLNNKSDNYVICMLKKLRAVQNWLQKTLQLTANNPFVGVNLGVEQKLSHPVYLTKDERNTVANFDLSDSPRLATQRDIFIFQCMTGCRYEDLRMLTPMNVNGSILEYVALKTCRNAKPAQPRIPLTLESLQTISKYAGCSKDNKLLPCTSVCQYNSDLKEIFKICGLNRKVYVLDAQQGREVQKCLYEVASSHMARRTFIGISYKMTKDPNIIASMSGHMDGSRAFDRYRDIDDEIRMEVIDLIK